MVNFSKDKCEVLDAKRRIVMIDSRLSDNCCHWDKTSKVLKCNLSRSDETMLWHKHLGHMSMSKICKTLKVDVVHGLPLLRQLVDNFCSKFLVGKQTKTSHKLNDHGGLIRVLELLHLD